MDLWSRLDDVRARWDVLEHPFYTRWSAGELSREDLARYAGQYRHAVVALAQAADRAAHAASRAERAELAAHAGEEAAHVSLWDAFADCGRHGRAAGGRGGDGRLRGRVGRRGPGPARPPRRAVRDRVGAAGDLAREGRRAARALRVRRRARDRLLRPARRARRRARGRGPRADRGAARRRRRGRAGRGGRARAGGQLDASRRGGAPRAGGDPPKLPSTGGVDSSVNPSWRVPLA